MDTDMMDKIEVSSHCTSICSSRSTNSSDFSTNSSLHFIDLCDHVDHPDHADPAEAPDHVDNFKANTSENTTCATLEAHSTIINTTIANTTTTNTTISSDLLNKNMRISGSLNPCASFLMLECLSFICNDEKKEGDAAKILSLFKGEDGNSGWRDDGWSDQEN